MSQTARQAPVTAGKPATVTEFTIRALVLGLFLCVILGAANAYLGLRAGMTIAATYPAAVLSMAILRLFKGSLLEENFSRTVGSIGESVAAGAIFTLPAFYVLGVWKFDGSGSEYPLATGIMILGGVLGILFVTILRRVMVEDQTLPFPESVAAAEIHKAGRSSAGVAKILFAGMGVGAFVKALESFGIFQALKTFVVNMNIGKPVIGVLKGQLPGGMTKFSAPEITPAYMSVGYIVGPELGALNFAGGLLAWGVLVPALVYFLGPVHLPAGATEGQMAAFATGIYTDIVKPIAVGGMLVGACYTLFKMRKNLILGLKRGFGDLKKSATSTKVATERSEQDLPFKIVLMGIGIAFICMLALYFYFSGMVSGALLSALVILVIGFMFSAVSGNLVGMIGSSNNPISGLTLATTVVAAFVLALIGADGQSGVKAAVAVAAIGCIACAVAGEMLQDLKVGHILKGTPWRMQVGNLIGVVVAGSVMYLVLMLLNDADLRAGGVGFGGPNLPAPQSALMASVSNAIITGQMAWMLVLIGVAMGITLICIRVRSPMLFSVGMYLPLGTTFAIFIGGVVRFIVNKIAERRGYNDAQKARIENAGVLTASGLIAGEALLALLVAGIFRGTGPRLFLPVNEGGATLFSGMEGLAVWLALPVAAGLIAYMIISPLKRAGRPDEAAPPPVVM